MLGREIPVIADPYVEMEFGTGALKVTPGHDPNDYEIGLRHNLPMINVMTINGAMNEHAGAYAGLDRFAARKKLWADMEAAGLTVKAEDRLHQVGHCQRCHTIVEPLLSEQWWVKMQPLAEPAIAAVKDGRIQIVPPPQLTKTDTPVADILHPVIVDLLKTFGHDLNAPILHGGDGWLGQWLHLHPPLLAEQRLDNRVAALAMTHLMRAIFRFHGQPSASISAHSFLRASKRSSPA